VTFTLRKAVVKSEETSIRYFGNLGFIIRGRDFEGKKKGADFFIECDGCIQSVEAKAKMGSWVQLLKPQLERLKKGGIVALVSDKNVEIETLNDIEQIEEVTLYRVTWKK
jgi:hypothetical protein